MRLISEEKRWFVCSVHQDEILCATVAHNNEQIVTGSRDRLIVVLRLETGEIEHSSVHHSDAVIALALTQDDGLLISGRIIRENIWRFIRDYFSITRSNNQTLDISWNATSRYHRYHGFTYHSHDYINR